MKTKTCISCEDKKPVSHFYRSSNTKDGHRGSCKMCKSSDAKTYYIKNRESIILKVLERRQKIEI